MISFLYSVFFNCNLFLCAIDPIIIVIAYVYSKNFAWEDQSKNQCYIHHIALMWSAIIQYSMVRCEKRIINNETKWCIQVNSAKISLLTEAFA